MFPEIRSKNKPSIPAVFHAMSRTSFVLLSICFLIILAHVWGAIVPSHWNWGVHEFAFYNIVVSVVALAAAGMLFFPAGRKKTEELFERFVGKFSSLKLPVVLIILSCSLLGLALIFRAKLHLLGDGAILLRIISGLNLIDETPPAFDHQPLVEKIFRLIKGFAQAGIFQNTETTFLIVDIVMGVVFVVIVTLFMRTLKLSMADKTLLGCFIFFCCGSQFFLGYVELYVFLYTLTACFVITGWLALEQRLNVIVPVVCYFIMLGLHFGSLAFGPGALLLLYFVWRERKREALIIAGAGIAAIILVVLFKHIQPASIIERFSEERTANVLPLFSTDDNFINPLISWRHLLDWLNANLLIVPFGIAVSVTLLISLRKQFRWNNPVLLFLATTALCGLAFTYAISSGLGMARDWDFLASFFLPVAFLNIYLFRFYLQSKEEAPIVVAIVALAFLHWIAWVGINASEERHLARAKLLNNPRLLGYVAQLNYLETMGAFYYARKDFPDAQPYFDRYLQVDSFNVRILANVSDLYRKMGDDEKSFHFLRRAAELHSPNASVYMDLGVAYAARGDTASAISLNEKAVEIDSLHAKAHANLGMLYFQKKNYSAAIEHYVKAIDLGLEQPLFYRDAATSFFFLEQYDNAVKYFDAYLALEPDDVTTRKVRDEINTLLSQGKKN